MCKVYVHDFEAGKFHGKWAVYDKVSRTFSYIGKGKKFCQQKAKELNDYCTKKNLEERK